MAQGRLAPELVTTQLAALDDAPRALHRHAIGEDTKTILVDKPAGTGPMDVTSCQDTSSTPPSDAHQRAGSPDAERELRQLPLPLSIIHARAWGDPKGSPYEVSVANCTAAPKRPDVDELCRVAAGVVAEEVRVGAVMCPPPLRGVQHRSDEEHRLTRLERGQTRSRCLRRACAG